MIRRAVASDLEPVFGLTREFSTSFEPDFSAFRRSFDRLLNDEAAALLVDDADGAVRAYLLGFIHDTLFANGPVAWIEEVMVDQGHRREGIGTELMHNFEAWASQHGARLMALATRRADAFYEALSFEESATYYRKLL